MTGAIIPFPLRQVPAVLVTRDRDDGGVWVVLVNSNGWTFGSRTAALADAHWHAANHNLPIRDVGHRAGGTP